MNSNYDVTQEKGIQTDILDLSETQDKEQRDIIQLFGKEHLEDIQRKLSKATGLAFVTVDYRGEPITECTYFTQFCEKVRSNPEAVTQCKASDAFGSIQAAVTQKPSVYFCPCGLLEVAIPIVFRGQYLGGFIGGQIRCEDAPSSVNRLESVIPSENAKRYREEQNDSLQKIPVYSYEKFLDMVNLVFLIINQLSENEINRKTEVEIMNRKLQKITEQKQKGERLVRENYSQIEELEVLSNPYFILDMLNSIMNLSVIEGADRTSHMVEAASDIIKYRYMQRGKMVYLEDAMKNIEQYLFMQKEKYSDRLEYSIQLPPNMNLQKMPAGVILPFIEHAVFYGIGHQQETLRIKVTSFYQTENVVIRIEDNGQNPDTQNGDLYYERLEEHYDGYYIQKGMADAASRLKKVYGARCDVIMENQGPARTWVIFWPKHFEEGIE